MSFREFTENRVLLRSMAFLRVSHPHQFRYNWLYPMVLMIVFYCSTVVSWDPAAGLYSGKQLERFQDHLTLLIPFFIASLAAVSTFPGPTKFDQEFEMSEPVTLVRLGERGGWVEEALSPRRFLSLLFGYATLISFGLVLFGELITPLALTVEALFGISATGVDVVLGLPYLLMFSQLVILTLLAVYYLSDYLARLDNRT